MMHYLNNFLLNIFWRHILCALYISHFWPQNTVYEVGIEPRNIRLLTRNPFNSLLIKKCCVLRTFLFCVYSVNMYIKAHMTQLLVLKSSHPIHGFGPYGFNFAMPNPEFAVKTTLTFWKYLHIFHSLQPKDWRNLMSKLTIIIGFIHFWPLS